MEAPTQRHTQPALEVRGLDVNYSGIRAVRQLDLTVNAGEIVTLIGPNGAGKSSTLMAIVGLVQRSGQIYLDGQDVSGFSTEQMVRAGLTLSPEGRRVFSGLTVAENLRLGGASNKDRAAEQVRLLDTFPVLKERYHQRAGTLSGGEQQILAIARALMSRPRILLLDEPSLGLAPKIVDTIFQVIAELRQWGISVLLVEQDIERALRVSDRGYVMSHGEILATDTAANMLSDANLKDLFFGAHQ
ncbi:MULTISPECIES: ABC transporter ATP-binding protein [unclassified Oceanobacter]|jgi:branched-chain amino acid transport system ATP-binding protein|uniref:ABC transporter ATP-binding protein n=1 Tax=unclassified Oceanobacter TaxID=2620260 RepID=UPI0026E1A62C|nr:MULTISPECIES: ABC transporter ATP-binding protein [unclassified Oceanobacter]MDO6683388.1 ABC transporter ATP-binding protein [Oceanobacter sp. 5_MG-2023]MDP2608416.1 ABC transporter ATP-binding protein [Oceanobacter sp. 1_MG-2023]MDP2611511.1 ABC transporter ATP-binding protein [Oceanobacter sp. 2_MG-2023]